MGSRNGKERDNAETQSTLRIAEESEEINTEGTEVGAPFEAQGKQIS